MKAFMKALGQLSLAIIMLFLSSFVIAWGYQVFWNDVALNVWQLFSSGDVINTMRISYGACLAIAFGRVLIYQKKSDEKTNDFKETAVHLIERTISRVIMIGLTLLVTSFVF